MRQISSFQRQTLTPLQSLIIRRWRPEWIQRACTRAPPAWVQAARLHNTAHVQNDKPYYVTTPIFYVNAAPHVGHMYSMVLTDVLKRWQQLKGRKAILCTGTDEHGLKMQQAAAKAGIDPQALCDTNAQTFQELANSINVSNDIFMRTTSRKHKEAVEYAWQILHDRGYIYESKHEGWYSVSDETFYPPSQVYLVIEPSSGRKMMASIETGKEVEWASERNYHFRLSAFKERLLKWYKENPEWIVPEPRMADVVQQVTDSLEDLSISRPSSRLTWGIPVPNDASQTTYVWLDALLNYATAVGYPFTPGEESRGGWPADVHVIGKDIVRFHCIYWPAFLMALDLPLPKQILTHAHWTLGQQKMAKSTGNVVNPFWALERFGVDVLRYYLVQCGGIKDDTDYDNGYIIREHRKGLQGGLGNLLGRITRGKGWDVYRAVQRCAPLESKGQLVIRDDLVSEGHIVKKHDPDYTKQFYGTLSTTVRTADDLMSKLLPNRVLRQIMKLVHDANTFLQHAEPWSDVTRLKLAAADTTGQMMHELEAGGRTMESIESGIDKVIYLNAEALRLVGIMLQPFIPASAKRLLDMLGVQEDRRTFEWCVLGKDHDYGKPLVELGRNKEGVLFPPLLCAD